LSVLIFSVVGIHKNGFTLSGYLYRNAESVLLGQIFIKRINSVPVIGT